MADIEYYEDTPSRPMAEGGSTATGLTLVVNWIGAILSVSLIVGMSIWAWQLTVRDVSGVPVIRALEGPMRVPPENPGGTVTDHQGLAVNRITEGEEAAPAAERIVLAPAPLDLEEIDLTSASLPESAAPASEAAGEDTMALIDRLLEEAIPLEPLDEAEAPAALAEAPARAAMEVISANVPGVARSLRPVSRPEELVQLAALGTAAAAPASAAPPVPGASEIDPDSLPDGTRLVQLGAFDDAETARAEWARLTRLFPDFFRDKDRVVQRAVSGGREFFRLRAHGFDDLADARRFCTALNAQDAPCIAVTVR